MRVKKMTIEEGRRVGISRFPQLPQDRKCTRHEEALLWSRLPFGALR